MSLNNDKLEFRDDETCCWISKELLICLKWICENDPDAIKSLMLRVWKKGLNDSLCIINDFDSIDNVQDLNGAILEFFNLFEESLAALKEKHQETILVNCHNSVRINKEMQDISSIFDFAIKSPRIKRNTKKIISIEDISATNSPIKKEKMLHDFLKNWNSDQTN
jgi:hypothetical protein